MKLLRDLELADKRVLVRVDFNVPMDGQGNITDDNRIVMALPTIRHILAGGGKLILCSHMGRPGGKRVEELSLAPVARHLGELLNSKVTLAPDFIGLDVEQLGAAMRSGEILLRGRCGRTRR